MNVYHWISVILACSLYIPLAWEILTKKVTQNLATWILWCLLDFLSAATIFVQHGNWYLPAVYVLGSIVIISCMLRARTISWSWFETIDMLMVIVCIGGWMYSGPRLGAILSTAGVVMAGFSQLKDAYLKPEEMPILIYLGYTVACVLSTIAGSEWSVEERLYPLACAIFCGVTTLVACKRFFVPKLEPNPLT